MPIYSIVSDYDIFYNSQKPDIIEKDIPGGRLSLMNVDGKYRPCGLFSTDPKMYLNPKYQGMRFYY